MRVYKNRPGVDGGEREADRDKGAAILADDHDPVAGANAQFAQPDLRFLYDRIELLVSPGAGGFDERGMIGSALNPRRDHVAEARQERIQNLGYVDIKHLCSSCAAGRNMLPNQARTTGAMATTTA